MHISYNKVQLGMKINTVPLNMGMLTYTGSYSQDDYNPVTDWFRKYSLPQNNEYNESAMPTFSLEFVYIVMLHTDV